jgi:hypothetical protein
MKPLRSNKSQFVLERLLARIPELSLLAARLSSNISPGAPYELEKVTGLIAELT